MHVAVGAKEANKVVSDIKNDVIQAAAQVSIVVGKELGP